MAQALKDLLTIQVSQFRWSMEHWGLVLGWVAFWACVAVAISLYSMRKRY